MSLNILNRIWYHEATQMDRGGGGQESDAFDETRPGWISFGQQAAKDPAKLLLFCNGCKNHPVT
jgi:hypothetical protein